jgi:hypothetical protein
MGFKDEMKEYDEQFVKDAAESGILADGKYVGAEVTEARLEQNSEDETWTAVMKFVVEGEGAVRKWYNLDNEYGRTFLAQDTRKMGYQGPLSEIEKQFKDEAFIGMICDVTVKTKAGDGRDFTNVYVDRVHGKGADVTPSRAGGDGGPAGGGTADDDDIPF